MKKLSLLLALMLILSLTACNSDDNVAGENPENSGTEETASNNSEQENSDNSSTEGGTQSGIPTLDESKVSNIEEFTIEKKADFSELVLKTINGDILKISNYKKKVVFLNFFSTT